MALQRERELFCTATLVLVAAVTLKRPVALEVDGRVDINARCYGCKKYEYAALASFDKKSKLLPSLSLACNDALRRRVHSPLRHRLRQQLRLSESGLGFVACP